MNYKPNMRTGVRFSSLLLARLRRFYESHGWQVRSNASFITSLLEEHERLLIHLYGHSYLDLIQGVTFEDSVAICKGARLMPRANAEAYLQHYGLSPTLKDPKRAMRERERRRSERAAKGLLNHTPPVPLPMPLPAGKGIDGDTSESERDIASLAEEAKRIASKLSLQCPSEGIESLKARLREELTKAHEPRPTRLQVIFKEGDLLTLGSAEHPDEDAPAVEASREALEGLLKEAVLQRKAIWLLNAATREVSLLYKWNEEDGSLQAVTTCSRFQASQGDADATESDGRALTNDPKCGINNSNI